MSTYADERPRLRRNELGKNHSFRNRQVVGSTPTVIIFYVAAAALCLFLLSFDVIVALVPTLIVAGFMVLATQSSMQSPSGFRRYLAAKPLSFWIMTWFLFELAVLTAVGTFFRGPGWSWVLPWRS